MKSAYFKLADGRQLAWRETGEGPAVVLIHGWTMSGAVFTEIAEHLSRDHRVLMPDLPGHGASSPSDNYSLKQMGSDLAAWLGDIAPSPRLACGWSLGGMVAMEMVAGSGVQLDGLVLMATTPRFTQADDWDFGLPATEVKLLGRNLQRNFQQTLGHFFKRMFVGETMATERLRTIRGFAIYQEKVPDQAAARETLQIFSNQDQRHLLGRISCPVMVLHGTGDQIAPVGAGRFLAASIPGARLKEYPETGHAPFLSRPDAVADDIREFVRWDR